MGSINDIGVPGQPLATPPLTVWQAAVRDALGGVDTPIIRPRAVQAQKSADQSGMAPDAPAGFSATLTNVQPGQTIIGYLNAIVAPSAAALASITGVPTGMAFVSGTIQQQYMPTPAQPWTIPVTWVFTATAGTVSLTYQVGVNTGTWTCKRWSSIVLLAI